MIKTVSILLFTLGVSAQALAFGCHPKNTDVANFTATVYASMMSNGCLNCHGTTKPPTSRLVFDTNPASTLAQQKSNLCIAYKHGQNGSFKLYTIPLMSHLHQDIAGRYTAAQLNVILNWIADYRLP